MDPLSIAATVLALSGTCVKVSKSLNDMRSKYGRAEVTITAISAECTIMSASLSNVNLLIKRDPESFASMVNARDGEEAIPLSLAFESAIDSCNVTMSALQDTLKRCRAKTSVGLLSWKSKAKYLWREEDMKDMLSTLRSLQQSLNFLLTAIQA